MTIEDFIAEYVRGTLGRKTRFSGWSVEPIVSTEGILPGITALTFTAHDSDGDEEGTETLAYRLSDGSVLVNSNELNLIGRRFAWGNEVRRWGRQTDHQRWCEKYGAIPIPFSLFTTLKADISKFSWIVKPPVGGEDVVVLVENPEYDKVRRPDVPERVPHKRHFTGASVFEIGGHVYLFDIDRQELGNGIMNPFLTELPSRPVLGNSAEQTIEHAYDLLMPDVVRERLTLDPGAVKRQGEFFFVYHSMDCPIGISLTEEEWQILRYPPSRMGFGLAPYSPLEFNRDDTAPFDENKPLPPHPLALLFHESAKRYQGVVTKYRSITPSSGRLQKGNDSGSHDVEKYVKLGDMAYVSGTVKHQRREHAPLRLEGWWMVYPNTGVASWSITGKID